eukprot:tig00021463_g21620.t1
MLADASIQQAVLIGGGILLVFMLVKKLRGDGGASRVAAAGPQPPPPPPQPVELRDFTPEELLEFDGRDESKPLYLAIKGRVYDVTKGKQFYGPGGPYAKFAGRDCSRALAKSSLDAADCRPEWEDLSWGEKVRPPAPRPPPPCAFPRARRPRPGSSPLASPPLPIFADTLNDWAMKFDSKYTHVGFVPPRKKEQ